MEDFDLLDGADSDCDGVVDDDRARVWNDPTVCGPELEDCSRPNAVGACDQARCAIDRCAPDWLDVDGDPANGCEYALDDVIWVDAENDGFADGSSESPYPTIAQALADGDALGGDARIAVRAGRYTESIRIEAPRIQLWAAEPGVIVQPGEGEVGLEVIGDHVEVTGLDLRRWRVGARLACAEGCKLIGSAINVSSEGPDPAHGVEVRGAPEGEDSRYRARGVVVRGNTITAWASVVEASIFASGLWVEGSEDARFERNVVGVSGENRGNGRASHLAGARLTDAVRPLLRGNRLSLDQGPSAGNGQTQVGVALIGGVGARSEYQVIAAEAVPGIDNGLADKNLTWVYTLHDHPGFSSRGDYVRPGPHNHNGVKDSVIKLGGGSFGATIDRLTVGARPGQGEGCCNDPHSRFVRFEGTGGSLRLRDSLLPSFGTLDVGGETLPPERLVMERVLLGGHPDGRLLRDREVSIRGGVRDVRDWLLELVTLSPDWGEARAAGPSIDGGAPFADCGLEPANAEGICRLDLGHLSGTPFAGASADTVAAAPTGWDDLECGAPGDHTEWTARFGECRVLRCEDGWRDDDEAAGCETAAQPFITVGAAEAEARPIAEVIPAANLEGGMVLIRSGRYQGPLVVPQGTVLRAVGGPVILLHDGEGPAIRITGDGARVEGFIVRRPARTGGTAVELEGCTDCAFTDGYIVGLSGEGIVGMRLTETPGARIERSWVWDLKRGHTDPDAEGFAEGRSPQGIWASSAPDVRVWDSVVGGLGILDVNGERLGGGVTAIKLEDSPRGAVETSRIARIDAPSAPNPAPEYERIGLHVLRSDDVSSRGNRFQELVHLGQRGGEGPCGDWGCAIRVEAAGFTSTQDLFTEVSTHAVLVHSGGGEIHRATVVGGTLAVAENATLTVTDSVLVGVTLVNADPFADSFVLRHSVYSEGVLPGNVDVDGTVRERAPNFGEAFYQDLCLGSDSTAIDCGDPEASCDFEPVGADEVCRPDPGFCGDTPRAWALDADPHQPE